MDHGSSSAADLDEVKRFLFSSVKPKLGGTKPNSH